MRHALWILVFFAATGSAQRHEVGDGPAPPVRYSLAPDILDAHNRVRERFHLAPLEWSVRLAARAQDWADTLLANRQFAHRPNSPFGQNLYAITGAAAVPERVVETWANEVRDYDYRSNRCRAVCGHFTQIVWKNTKEVGCAAARGGGREVWVCDYDPPGNWVGERPW